VLIFAVKFKINMLTNKNCLKGLWFIVLILIISCEPPSPNFTITVDPNIPGKVTIQNSSAHASDYNWVVDGAGRESINPSMYSSTNKNPDFYMPYNGDFYIKLTASGKTKENDKTKYFNIANIPSKVTITGATVTKFASDLDPDGKPDLMIYGSVYGLPTSFDANSRINDVSAAQLPISLKTSMVIADSNFSQLSREIYIYILDIDGVDWANRVTAERLGSIDFNPFHFTHEYKPSESNYPKELVIKNDKLEATIHLKWE